MHVPQEKSHVNMEHLFLMILAAPVQHHDVRVDESILEKNIYYNCLNCREKK
jgi:hypothetical protein